MPDVYQRRGAAVYAGGPMVVTGRAERHGGGVSLLGTEVARLEIEDAESVRD